jgi:hypothetical protein
MVAEMQATEVPMVVPLIWWNQQSSSWKGLHLMTPARRLITISVGKSGESPFVDLEPSRLASMLVYMDTVSEVKRCILR